MWDDPVGRSEARWKRLADVGLLGITIPEEFGGYGGDEIETVLLLEEAGRAALPEPFLEPAALGSPLLARAGSDIQKSEWLPRLADGSATVTVGLESHAYVA